MWISDNISYYDAGKNGKSRIAGDIEDVRRRAAKMQAEG